MRVLFMCTANSCRSILSEAMFNHLAPSEHQAVSSGSFPRGEVLPRTLVTLREAGFERPAHDRVDVGDRAVRG